MMDAPTICLTGGLSGISDWFPVPTLLVQYIVRRLTLHSSFFSYNTPATSLFGWRDRWIAWRRSGYFSVNLVLSIELILKSFPPCYSVLHFNSVCKIFPTQRCSSNKNVQNYFYDERKPSSKKWISYSTIQHQKNEDLWNYPLNVLAHGKCVRLRWTTVSFMTETKCNTNSMENFRACFPISFFIRISIGYSFSLWATEKNVQGVPAEWQECFLSPVIIRALNWSVRNLINRYPIYTMLFTPGNDQFSPWYPLHSATYPPSCLIQRRYHSHYSRYEPNLN